MQTEEIAKRLIKTYTLPYRLFGCSKEQYGTNEWRRRRLFANIIVGGSRDEMAVKGAVRLFEVYTFDYIADRSNYAELRRSIADILEDECDIRYSGKKADYILNTAYALKEKHNGVVPDNFDDLIALPGVGRHAASVVLALAFDKQTFGVDLHVRRIAKRMGLVDEKATDRKIEKQLSEIKNAGHLSRAFVDFGKDVCKYNPQCKRCQFKNIGCNPKIK